MSFSLLMDQKSEKNPEGFWHLARLSKDSKAYRMASLIGGEYYRPEPGYVSIGPEGYYSRPGRVLLTAGKGCIRVQILL